MSKKGKHVPNAWDDEDWEALADRAEKENAREPQDPVRLTKTERLALHRESNRKLWESAESPEPLYFVEASSNVPLATAYKTQVKVLSRKPVIAKRDPTTDMANLAIGNDGDGDDDDCKEEKEVKMTPEERMALEKSILEEKQRAYDEARRRIFGDEEPQEELKQLPRNEGGPSRGSGRGRGRRGRGRGFAGAGSGSNRDGDSRGGSPARPAQSGARELYDPGYAPKPGGGIQRPDSATQGKQALSRDGSKISAIREPKGPDGSGRGGFGFARRGTRGSS
ncbi:hypothetical protein jhhlp_007247 [Lomentospora prolificans]|uniref:SUZ domain-containing protein n=1 Tax=Lomentospora prolificans TaxID=41688 RepID=A0A2N3N244_9PEZI|nr:hypothetical protein jhhlp_007247 [Lomentospora prolificans]